MRIFGTIGTDGRFPCLCPTALDQAKALGPQVFALVESLALNQALGQIFELVKAINIYLLEQSTPWREAKVKNMARVETILDQALEALRLAAVLLQPVLPERMTELWQRLGWQPTTIERDLAWGSLRPSVKIESGEVLFPKTGQ